MKMNIKVIILFLLAIGVLSGFYFFNSSNNQQVQSTTQTTPSTSPQDNWSAQEVTEVGLTLRIPPDTTFRKEVADNAGRLRNVGFYIEKGNKDNPSYMLYGLYQADKEASQADIEDAKMEMDKNTIKEVEIDGYKGIEGLILGEKTRYYTIILKNNRLISFSTIPPTQENKELTDKILNTVSFSK